MLHRAIEHADRIDPIVRRVIHDYMRSKGYPPMGITREVRDFDDHCWVQWDGETTQPGGLLVTLVYNPSKTPDAWLAVGEHPATGMLQNIKLDEVIKLLERITGLPGKRVRIHK